MVRTRSRYLIVVLVVSSIACNVFTNNSSYSLYDFLENARVSFSDNRAIKPRSELSDLVRSITLGGKRKDAAALPVPSMLTMAVEIPAYPEFSFSLAMIDTDYSSRDKVGFQVYVESAGNRTTVFEEIFSGDQMNRWNDRQTDLTPWAGKPVVLSFQSFSAPGKRFSSSPDQPLVLWGEPSLLGRLSAGRLRRSTRLYNHWHRSLAPKTDISVVSEVGDTMFSHHRGFYEHPFEVSITTGTPGATVVYTTDGSEPGPAHGNKGSTVFVSQTTVLRAMAFKAGLKPTNVDTQTYIFPATTKEQTEFPLGQLRKTPLVGDRDKDNSQQYTVAWLDLDVSIDPDIVNNINNEEFRDGLLSLPTLSVAMDAKDLFDPLRGIYLGRGSVTRRASVELVYPERPAFSGFEGFQVDCGIRMHSKGNAAEKRSFRLVFTKEFGPGKLKYPFFESAVHHAESAVSRFDTLVLRSGGQANWSRHPEQSQFALYVRDQHLRDTQHLLSGVSAHGIFAHLYLNGIYWGVYNAVERPDQRFLASYYGGNPDTDWYAVNRRGALLSPPADAFRRWENMQDVAKRNNLSDPVKYREIKMLLDTAQFSDYILLNFYSGMGDWGFNNWYSGVRIVPPGPAMYFCWDSELTYGLVPGIGNPTAWVNPDFAESGHALLHRLWRQLNDSNEFKLEFADRTYRACYNGGPLTDSENKAAFQRLCDHVEKAMFCESARWGDAAPGMIDTPRTLDGDWKRARNLVINHLMEGNAERLIKALRNHDYYPSIDPPTFVTGDDQITIHLPSGADRVYYTTDGTDPKLPGVSNFSAPSKSIPISPQLLARSKKGTEWSALNEYLVWQLERPGLR